MDNSWIDVDRARAYYDSIPHEDPLLNKYRKKRIDPFIISDGCYNADNLYSLVSSDCIHPYKGFPCGCCANCMAKKAMRWSGRIMLESYECEYVLSFCLTFTDAMLESKTVKTGFDRSLHGYEDVAILCKRDFQLFIKRLRKNNPELSIKYFIKGEYGGQLKRPHAHVLLFVLRGCTVSEERLKKMVLDSWYNGIEKYKEETLPNMLRPNNIGKAVKVNPIVCFGTFNDECAKYCAKYVSKEVAADVKASDIQPEFQLTSRGLAVEQFMDQVASHKRMLDELIANFETMSWSRFKRMFERFMEWRVPNSDSRISFPSFMRRYVFDGYYEYGEKRDEDSPAPKYWKPAPTDERIEFVDNETGEIVVAWKGEWKRNCYTQMISHYLLNCKAEFFNYDGVSPLPVDAVPETLLNKLHQKYMHIMGVNDRRDSGAYNYRKNEDY